jgi:hypothetical protein
MTRVEDMSQNRDLDQDGDDRRRSFQGGVEEVGREGPSFF